MAIYPKYTAGVEGTKSYENEKRINAKSKIWRFMFMNTETALLLNRNKQE